MSTPVRPVFDARMRMAGGCSLNDILPKGSNNMNNLVQILIRWSVKPFAFHSDISKMYNRVHMEKCHWRYQLYLWDDNLEVGKEPRTKVIKTCIYGVRPSGNQAERALRLTAELCKDEYPMAFETIHNDLYIDDCISGEATLEDRDRSTEELTHCLKKGGFTLKGLTFSGQAPDNKLSKDGKSIGVGGLKWFPEKDVLMLKAGAVNFARKTRGRKVKNLSEIPDVLTLRECVRVVAEIFDPLGKITPILASFKLDISHLHRCGLKWDSEIPENLRSLWASNFDVIKGLGNIVYNRAIVPQDAKSLDIFTIETGDASLELICSAIYARFEKRNGDFSCQLVFSRSKVVPDGTSIPRAELMAAALNAATGHIVHKAFGKYHKGSIKLSDSMVALHWIACRYNSLKTWVRTRVVEINRLCDVSSWRYVDTANMIADLGTRKGAQICDVAQDSKWINGFPWMSGPQTDFPVQTLEEIKLSRQDVVEVEKESIVHKTFHSNRSACFDDGAEEHIRNRYQFSKYVIDPNRFRFRKVVRILSIVLKFIKSASKNIGKIQNCELFKHDFPGNDPDMLRFSNDRFIVTTGSSGKCPGCRVVEISETLLQSSMYYFSRKASDEVKNFLEPYKYENISKEINGVLYYSGRILEDFQYGGYPNLCRVALDLFKTSFCVPVMDQYSPVAISIALETHWHHPDVRHKGVDAIWRQMERICHIIGGQQLAVSVKKRCKKCRVLNKTSIEVAMGPIQVVNFSIAPPFFACQLDIMGPLNAFSVANKRATIKVWLLIFCCCTTGAKDIRVIEDY